MSLLAAHINDAGISVLSAERLLYRQPGFALLDDEELTTGSKAFENARIKPRRIQNRFWSELTTDGLADRRFQHLSAADLVSRQLEQIWQAVDSAGDRLVVAVPAYMTGEHLGLFLGIANELNVPVVGLVDAAVAASVLDGDAMVFDAELSARADHTQCNLSPVCDEELVEH